MNDQSAQRGAALACRAHGAEDDGTHRQIQIGRGCDHHGIVAPQLQNALAKAGCHLGAHGAAHAARTRGGHQGDLRAVHQGLGHIAVAEHDLRQTRRSTVTKTGDRPLQGLEGGQARQRGFLRGLEDHRITTDQCQCRIPGKYCAGKIEGGDHGHRPQRVVLFHHAVAGAFGHDGLAMQLAGQADGKLADVHAFLYFPQAFLQDLAHLARDHLTDIGLAAAQLFAPQPDQLAPHRGGHQAPLLKGLGRAIDHGRHGCHGQCDQLGQRCAVDGGAHGDVIALVGGQIDAAVRQHGGKVGGRKRGHGCSVEEGWVGMCGGTGFSPW